LFSIGCSYARIQLIDSSIRCFMPDRIFNVERQKKL